MTSAPLSTTALKQHDTLQSLGSLNAIDNISSPPVLKDTSPNVNMETDDTVVVSQEEAAIEDGDAQTEAEIPTASGTELPENVRDDSGESTREPDPERSGLGDVDEKENADWDPLQRREKKDGGHTQDVTEDITQDITVVEEGEVVDSRGRVLFPESEGKPSPSVSRHGSNLRLDLKSATSPQPWEFIEPPTSNGKRSTDIYSTLESRKFNTLRSHPQSRPLIPKSSYYFGPPPSDAAYGTPPIGQIGVHHPREIIRVERDYSGGELIQFAPIYPLELEGRITPTQFLESINAINELLISAFSVPHSFFDNLLAVFTLQLSKLVVTSHYEKEMRRLQNLIDDLNSSVFNPVGLNILWPRKVAFLFLEIEYY